MSEEPSVSFYWKIENFLFFAQGKSKSMSSPAFYVETFSQSEWNLEIYNNDDEIKLFLHNICFNDRSLFIDYTISYLYLDGSVLWIADSEKDIQINSGISYGTAAYPEKGNILGNQGKPFHLSTTLTILCQIWPSRRVLKRSVKYVSCTCVEVERTVFHWEVPEFSQLELSGERRTSRIIIGSDKPTFSLELFLEGADANQANVCIDIKQLNENISDLFCFCKISVLDARGGTLRSHSDYQTFEGSDCVWNFNWCLTKNKIMANQHEYLDCDVLNLLFAITFNTGEKHSKIECVTTLPSWVQMPSKNGIGTSLNDLRDPDSDTSLSDVRDPDSDTSLSDIRDPDSDTSLSDVRDPDSDNSLNDVLKTGSDSSLCDVHDHVSDVSPKEVHDLLSDENTEASPGILQNSFHHLYQDRSSTDFELWSESVSFPVHKMVLAARSSVFKAIFAFHAVNFVEIPDVNADTLSMLLKFIYTGNVESLDLSSAADLYYAADKYQIHSLKRKCYYFLYGSNS